jgi:ankyrin repeat domain-containing protein 11/12
LPANTTTVTVSTSITGSSTPATVQTVAPTSSQQQQQTQQQNLVELHPRKRKIKASSREPSSSSADIKDSNSKDGNEKIENLHPHEQPFTNCYQMYIDLRKQIEQRHRNLHPVEPRPLKGIEDYLMNRRTYLLHGKSCTEPNIIIPPLLPPAMKDIFIEQEKERNKLKLRHIVEKEKMVLSKEQEILRVHCKAAQMIANQSQPFSVCTILKDEEVYSMITPEQEEKYRNKNRERSHGRVFFQALKDLDDKYDKIKVSCSNINNMTYLFIM